MRESNEFAQPQVHDLSETDNDVSTADVDPAWDVSSADPKLELSALLRDLHVSSVSSHE